ncbi:MAG TPA: sigma-70 family RNA polymerase sigma factor [Vicinamibacteria bacterium]|nr:sigma-70 family RNA polymerase sigma factor [Vicinamibacteria bacterium]
MVVPPVQEAELLKALREGREEAFETLVRAHSGRMLSVCRRILRNDEEAKDAVQEAFVSAFRGLSSFEGASLLGTWLHRIAVNASLMRLRSKKRRPEESIDELLPTFRDDGHARVEPRDFSPSALQLVESRETREFVRGCVDRLPEIYRVVLLLRDIEEMDTSEAAEVLGVSEGVVKVRLHRARHALRRLLGERFEEPPS